MYLPLLIDRQLVKKSLMISIVYNVFRWQTNVLDARPLS